MRILTASGQQPDRITPESIISGSFSTLRQCTGVSAMLTADRLPAGQICVGPDKPLDKAANIDDSTLSQVCHEFSMLSLGGLWSILTDGEIDRAGILFSERNQLNESSGDWRSIELVPIHQLGCSMVLPSCMGQPQGGVEWKSDEAIYPRVPDHYHPCVLLDLAIWTSAQLRQVYLS
ncbi:hypothetical protein PGTUg99_011593 [Puccinia graminis f. sp. tritici]|uniref:Uncharacterized protein n=1 Tax=Puccinia graminis f. sp. tritici TaxID=56615 RepID=A0A5B0PW63_PUCGR|nr:hypothetical protein PGTUg99_011593 [Puccinia graminis f. sp. tritici]